MTTVLLTSIAVLTAAVALSAAGQLFSQPLSRRPGALLSRQATALLVAKKTFSALAAVIVIGVAVNGGDLWIVALALYGVAVGVGGVVTAVASGTTSCDCFGTGIKVRPVLATLIRLGILLGGIVVLLAAPFDNLTPTSRFLGWDQSKYVTIAFLIVIAMASGFMQGRFVLDNGNLASLSDTHAPEAARPAPLQANLCIGVDHAGREVLISELVQIGPYVAIIGLSNGCLPCHETASELELLQTQMAAPLVILHHYAEKKEILSPGIRRLWDRQRVLAEALNISMYPYCVVVDTTANDVFGQIGYGKEAVRSSVLIAICRSLEKATLPRKEDIPLLAKAV